jgi:ABC-type uncharacterized transport system substrate-binding protein
MVRRRQLLTLLGGAAAWPLTARAQQAALPVIGYFSARSPNTDVAMLTAFHRGLGEAGYVEGKNVAIEFRWANGQMDRLPELAADLVQRRVSVIVTTGGPLSALAAKSATATIPILFVSASDPVQEGLVASLNRPGGNVTGVATLFLSLGAKQLGLVRDLLPDAHVIGLLADPNTAAAELQIDDVGATVRTAGHRLIVFRASNQREIATAFAALSQERADALLVVSGPFFLTHADYLVTLAAVIPCLRYTPVANGPRRAA